MDAETTRTLRRWSRDEYERLIAIGFFPAGERAELIDGEIWQMTPQGSAHATAVCAVEEALRAVFQGSFHVRIQLPLALDASSEPEPDISVVPGTFRDYRAAHPSTAVLVVEVADTTLETDRRDKGSLYARAGIQEYWVINLVHQVVEVYREPIADPKTRYGWTYNRTRAFAPDEIVTPLVNPQTGIRAGELLA